MIFFRPPNVGSSLRLPTLDQFNSFLFENIFIVRFSTSLKDILFDISVIGVKFVHLIY